MKKEDEIRNELKCLSPKIIAFEELALTFFGRKILCFLPNLLPGESYLILVSWI